MSDRALIATGAVGALLAAACCAAPLLAAVLPLAAFGAWLAGAGLIVLVLLIVGCCGLVAWIIHRRRAKAACGATAIPQESMKL
ncbi:MAG: mercury transport protein [Rhizobiales bacterium 65-79]|mgnify:CR=1 FL=1|nr:mercury transport protein [Hyphomicrobiales bacterium]OJU02076.1 MAG: mercury transport protein [Rhizobiales bacterium 65-79]